MSMEIEFKWEANLPRAFYKMQRAVALANARITPAKHWTITDVYLDAPTRNFKKKKIAFRVRCINKKWEATFKTRSEIKNGKAVRREETWVLTDVKNLSQALQFLHRKKTWKGLNVENLQPLFVLKNHRQTREVLLPNMQAELAFDTCEIIVCGRRVFFKEIELELKKGSAALLEQLAAALTQKSGLKRAQISKVKTALALRKLWEGK